MRSSKSCRHFCLIYTILQLIQFASTQDSQKFYFPGNTQNHFVPSSYLKSRPQSQRDLGFPPKPDSYQEQILFISGNDNQQQVQSPLTSSYGFGSSQFSKTRNPDYFDISPRPFGVPATGGFSPLKGVRPSSDFLQQSRLRSNVPHQQSQFLQHFSEPSHEIIDKGINSNRLISTGFGNNPSRLTGHSDFAPLTNRNVATTPHYSEETPLAARPQQQLPFRNTRNRFKPSTSQTSTSTTTEVIPTRSTKRFNRFGIGRTTASTSKLKTLSSTEANTPVAAKPVNKSHSFQPRRPAFLSREINEPINAFKHKSPQSLGNGRVRIENKAIKSSQSDVTSTSTQKSTTESEDEQYERDERDELHEENHIVKETANAKYKKEIVSNNEEDVVDKKGSIGSTTETLPSSDRQEDHTLILTSNFFLPDSGHEENNAQTSNEKTSSELNEYDHLDESTETNLDTTVVIDDNAEDAKTTYPPSDYEYEYVEDDESTESITELTKPITAVTTTTTTTPKITSVATEDSGTSPVLLETNTKINLKEDEVKATSLPETTTIQITSKEHDSKDIENEDDEEDDDEEYYEEFEEEDNEDDSQTEGKKIEISKQNSDFYSDSTSIPSDSSIKSEHGTEGSSKDTLGDPLDREVISVVTTKSVINGSTAFPSPVTPKITPLSHEEETIFRENQMRPAEESEQLEKAEDLIDEPTLDDTTVSNATESYVVVASIQTSRSINGARFLPFPAIEQEETKQKLSDLDRKVHASKGKPKDSETPTELSSSEFSDQINTTPVVVDQGTTASSTESIIDKLDRVQSELSSGLLSGKYPIISGMDLSTPPTKTTSSSKFPNIRKFQHKTTASPKVKIHHIDDAEMDELAGLLPAGFKPRSSYKNRKITTTTSTTISPNLNEKEAKKPARNSTISRSFKNNIVQAQNVDLEGLLPKGYKPPSTNSSTDTDIKSILGSLNFNTDLEKLLPKDYKLQTTAKPAVTLVDDISKFLPPGYKLNSTTTKKPKEPVILVHDDLSKFLPPGYKPPKEEDDNIKSKLPGELIKKLKINDNIQLLPPDYKPNATENIPSPIKVDISALLPKDYKPSASQETTADGSIKIESDKPTESRTTTPLPITEATTASSGFKVVFPKGIHKRIGAHRLTTPKSQNSAEVTSSPAVVIKKGPPTRATTEFTGWPTPSTTPISIEKLLEQAKTVSINFEDLLSSSSTTTTKTIITTTMTTTTTPKPTKPGYCSLDCDLAATIKIIDGVTWKPELLDHNTLEWKTLAREVEAQLNEVYANAPQLSKWFKKVRIDSFSKGSVLVDYYVELANLTKEVNTLEIKKLFHEALTSPPQPILPNKLEIENETDNENEGHMDNLNEYTEEKLIKESFLMGKYVIDPVATDFSVIPKAYAPNVENDVEDLLIPQWAWVVIVIGVGSLVFVVIFGVTVLLNRQKRSKKTPIPLTNDMLNELKINHMGGDYGVDDFYNLDDAWADTKQPIKPKRFVNSVHDSNGSNIYDSWRSTRHGDYFYDQKGDSIQRSHRHQMHPQHQGFPVHQQYPDAFADAHQMYTYNNQGSRSRYPRDYDPDF